MNRQIYEEASDWLVEFRTEEVDGAARQRFERWLATSPEHVQAYLEVMSVWEAVGASDPADARTVHALIERARASGNVVSLDVPASTESRTERHEEATRSRRRPFFTAIAAVAASVLVAICVAGGWLYSQRDIYSTAVGEQRSILLADGSTVELNARSTVRVRYSETRRDIELLAGQALFQVAKDRARPFIVTSNQVRVRAVGTRFDINQRRRATIVTVVEGTVSVSAETSKSTGDSMPALERGQAPSTGSEGTKVRPAQDTVMLTAGEQATLASGVLIPKHTDTVMATAWTQRRLIFENTPLEEVAEEFNRYNMRQLVIEGGGLEDFHVSGGFSSSDPEPLLRFLRLQDGIQIVEQHDEIVVSRRR